MPNLMITAAALYLASSSATAMAGGDAVRGKVVYENRCEGCHALDENRVGPAHRGVFGRKAGAASGFDYSPALAASGLVWTAPNLDRWLRDPRALAPGTRMAFRLSDPGERADVIAYLRETSRTRR